MVLGDSEKQNRDQTFDLESDFQGWLPTYEEMFRELFAELSLNPPRDIFDAGCGLGASTLAIGRVFPTSHIYAVSLIDEPTKQVREELKRRLSFKKESVLSGIKNSKRKFDLLLLARVPFHGINTERDYTALSGSIKTNGHVLTVGDCKLDTGYLGRSGFKMVGIPSDTQAGSINSQLWRKIDH